MYAINNQGGFRLINSASDLLQGETLSETQPAPVVISPILGQIAALEAKITPRRVREALLTGDHSFVQSIDAQIAALRAQL